MPRHVPDLFRFLTWVDEVLRPSFTSAKLCPSERIASLLPNGPEAGIEDAEQIARPSTGLEELLALG